MHISINPTANSEVRNPNWNCCPCQSKLCVAHDPAQGLIWFLIIQRCSPLSPHNEDGKSLATQNKASAEAQDTDKRHTAVMSTCWGGQPFPLACYSADQGQAGDQIKVLVWGELGPGAREAAWGMCAHTHPKPRWRASGLALLQDKVKKRSRTRNRTQASRLLGGCWKM